MKTIGLIGGMSWESTISYYQLINEGVKSALGGLHSAKILLYSVEFSEIEANQRSGNWEACGDILSNAAKSLEAGGADVILICTNTMHKVFEQVKNSVSIPLLHIADAISVALQANHIQKVALLGTKYTMCQSFFKDRVEANGIEIMVPNENDIEIINRVIFEELCLGECKEASRKAYASIVHTMAQQGAQGVILGCTEIGLLLHQEDVEIPVFDTTYYHAQAALQFALQGDK